MAAANRAIKHPKVTLGLRLKAWWEGYEIKVRPKAGEIAESGASSHASGGAPGPVPWSEARIALAELVWGQGCCAPGDKAYLRELVKPFALNENNSVIDVGAGLGEAVRQIAKGFKCRVKGYEPDPKLAAAGMALSVAGQLSTRAKILALESDDFPPEPDSFDCVLSKDFLHLVEDKRSLLTSLAEALKRPGQMLFTDYVLASESGPHPAVDAWAEIDPEPVHLWTVAQYEALFAQLGLEHRISEDISDDLKRRVVSGWEQHLSEGRAGAGSDPASAVMVREVEIWTRRVAALQSGELRAYRFFVLKRNEGQKLAVS